MGFSRGAMSGVAEGNRSTVIVVAPGLLYYRQSPVPGPLFFPWLGMELLFIPGLCFRTRRWSIYLRCGYCSRYSIAVNVPLEVAWEEALSSH
jgi:hypothetical protein